MKSHFYCSIVRAILLVVLPVGVFIASSSGAAGQSCMTLLYPDDPFGQTSNPDSVKISTCDSAGGLYAKGWFSISFTKCVIPPEYASADSSVYVSWQDIDTAFQELRSFFAYIEEQYGEFTLLKVMPQITDTSLPGVKEYHLRFANEVNIQSVEQFFIGAPNIFQCVYMNRAGKVLSTPTFYHPDDRAFQVGIAKDYTNFPEVKFDERYSDESMRNRRFGGYAGLYLSHVPLAWEITRGKEDISIGIEDYWLNPGETGFRPIPPGQEHPDVNDANFKIFGWENADRGKVKSKVIQGYYHGFGIAGVLAGIEHTASNSTHPRYGTIGVAPEIKKIFGTNGNVTCAEGYGCIDTDPVASGIQPPDIVTCSIVGPGGDNLSWKHGVVEVGAIGNFTRVGTWSPYQATNMSNPTEPLQYDWVLDGKGWRQRDEHGNKTNATYEYQAKSVLLLAIPHAGATKPYDLTTEVDIYAVLPKSAENCNFAYALMTEGTHITKAIGATQVNYVPSKHNPPYWSSCPGGPGSFDFNLRTQFFTEFVNSFTMPHTSGVTDPGAKLKKFTDSGKLNQDAFSDIIVPSGIMVPNYAEPENQTPYPVVWGLSGSSFAAPVVAGTVGLMRSVNKYLGTSLSNGIPVDPRELQERAYNTVTFTTEKVPDYLAANPNAMHQYYDWIDTRTIPDSIDDMNYTKIGLHIKKYVLLEASQTIKGYPVFNTGSGWSIDNAHEVTLASEFYDFNKMSLNYTVQNPDKLKRSWAHRHGFGVLNSYRAVIHSVPSKGDYEYTGTSAWTSNWSGISTLIDQRKVLHLGSKAKERSEQRNGTGGTTDVFNVLEYGGYRFEKTGYNGEVYENNNGETLFNPESDTELDFPVGENQTLAIDGIVQQTQSPKKKVTIKTVANSSGKILATGYLDEVTLRGTMKLDHLNVYADDNPAEPKGAIIIEGTTPSELWGRLKLYGNAILDIKSGGKLVVQAGGEIHLNGTKDLTIGANATLELGHGSIIRTGVPRNADNGVPTGQITRAIVVNEGGKLVIPDNVFFQQIDGKVIVKSGGQFIIGKNSNVQMAQFEVQPGGKLILDEGCTLELDEYESICDGHLIVNSAIKESNGDYNIWPTTPKADPARVTITALRECGNPAAVASIKCSYDITTLPIAPMPQSIDQIQASLKLRYADVRNVKLNVVNVYTPPVKNCTFAADRATVKSKTFRQMTKDGDVLAKLDALFVYNFDRDIYRQMIRSSTTRSAYFLMRQTGIASLEFQNCKFFDQNIENLPRHYGLGADNTYAFDGVRLSNCFSVLIGDASSEPSSAPNCDFQRLKEAILTRQCEVSQIFGSKFDYCNDGVKDEGSAVKICSNLFQNTQLGGSLTASAQGIVQKNSYTAMQACTDLHTSERHFFRGNTMSAFVSGILHDNSESVVRSEGLEWDASSTPPKYARREYGKNEFQTTNVIATNPFLQNAKLSAVDIQFTQTSDYSFLDCGYNILSEKSLYHLDKTGTDPLSRTVATLYNKWQHESDPTGFIRHQTMPLVVPIDSRDNWDKGRLPQQNDCNKHFGDECHPDPEPEPCPECPKINPWALEYHPVTLEYIGPTMITKFPGLIQIINDTSQTVYYRKDAIMNVTYGVIHGDTNGIWTDSLIAVLGNVATHVANNGLLRSTAYLRLGILQMNDGQYDNAIASFDSVRALHNNRPDSATASWFGIQANAYRSDTTHGFVFDSLMNIAYDASLTYRLDTPLPDTGLVKPGIPIPPDELAKLSGAVISSIVPNPVTTTATIIIALPEQEEHIRLTLYDALGHPVLTVVEGKLSAGQHSIPMPIGNLPVGVYHLRLNSHFRDVDTREVAIIK